MSTHIFILIPSEYNTDSVRVREEEVLRFIRTNQGCNKQQIVEYLKDKISRKTLWKIFDNLEKERIIKLNRLKGTKSYKIYLNKDNPLVILRLDTEELKQSFDLVASEILRDSNNVILDSLRLEYQINVKIISLLLSLLNLISFIIHEICIYFLGHEIKDRKYLYRQLNYLNIRISNMYLTFNQVQKKLNPVSQNYVSIFASRNNTPIKTFLWSILIFYETRKYPRYFIYTKDFKSKLDSVMKLLYDFGKKYSPTFYDEIIHSSSTYNNPYAGFPYPKYVMPMRKELKKLDYKDFSKVLIERCLYLEQSNPSTAAMLLHQIENINSKNNPVQKIEAMTLTIFENIIIKVIKKISPIGSLVPLQI